jgi:hypothetical protein
MSLLQKAKIAVMRQVGYVQKSARMQGGGGNYTYARESDFIAAIRPAMIEAGLTLVPSRTDVVHHEVFTTSGNKTSHRVIVRRVFQLAHESGESEQIDGIGEGTDFGDKASYKAMTGALKYALRQAFLIETGDDPDDAESEQYARHAVPTTQQKPNLTFENAMRILQHAKPGEEYNAATALIRESWEHFTAEQQRSLLQAREARTPPKTTKTTNG